MKPSEDVTGIRWKICHVTVSSNENTVIVKIAVMMEVYFLGGGWVLKKKILIMVLMKGCTRIKVYSSRILDG